MNAEHVLKGPVEEVSLYDAGFPESLRAISNPPKRLYIVGDASAIVPGLAVIGARKATPYGLSCARRFASIAAEKGVCIISGGARGCDSEAHRAAIDANGPTVVFLGGGCDCVYPAENVGLFQRVVDCGGAVVSEHPWGFKPLRYTFRARNRLIAGLADAVLIVEAGLPSGTFSTADEALDAGKEVFVVPGAITSVSSRGSNRLLYQGATPVVDDETFEDALFRACGMLKRPRKSEAALKGEFGMIVSAILAQPLSMEDLYEIALAQYGPADAREKLMCELTVAETEGVIARQADGKWGAVVVT